nr:hypothetical protein [Tanacetum cinerariifolium]
AKFKCDGIPSQNKKCDAIVTLKPIQKAWLARIGFADVLEFKCDGIPSKMGFYVVDNFSQHNMEIKVNERSIEITQESIGEMLGIRNEGVDIMEVEDANDEEMVQNWVDQFEEGKKITPGAVKFLIKKSKVEDANDEEMVQNWVDQFEEGKKITPGAVNSGPALNEMTPATISSGLVKKPSSSTPYLPPSRNDWDLLFQPIFDELLNASPSDDTQAPEVIALIADVIPLVPAE